MRFDVITIFPEFFGSVFDHGITRRAAASGLVEILVHDLRQWAIDKHRMVDDRPFGGGDGMVLKPEPIFGAVEALMNTDRASRVLLMSPQGRSLDQALVKELSEREHLLIICGRYEGVDERVAQNLVTDEVSIGDYILSGGEPAAVVLIDAIVRLLPGALGSDTSVLNESFSSGMLDCPHYTRPPEFRGMKVPEVLLSGNHAAIEKWRRMEAYEKTRRNRPDLLEKEL